MSKGQLCSLFVGLGPGQQMARFLLIYHLTYVAPGPPPPPRHSLASPNFSWADHMLSGRDSMTPTPVFRLSWGPQPPARDSPPLDPDQGSTGPRPQPNINGDGETPAGNLPPPDPGGILRLWDRPAPMQGSLRVILGLQDRPAGGPDGLAGGFDSRPVGAGSKPGSPWPGQEGLLWAGGPIARPGGREAESWGARGWAGFWSGVITPWPGPCRVPGTKFFVLQSWL